MHPGWIFCGRRGDDFSLPTSVLHQTTIKCHWTSVVCLDQYAERAFVVAVWSVFVVFAFLSTRAGRSRHYLDAVEFCACEATHFCFPSLHQKTTKFHRPTAGYSDQRAGRPFLVLLLIPSDQRRERSLCFASRFFEIQVAGRCVSRSVLLPSYCPSFRKETRNFVAS